MNDFIWQLLGNGIFDERVIAAWWRFAIQILKKYRNGIQKGCSKICATQSMSGPGEHALVISSIRVWPYLLCMSHTILKKAAVRLKQSNNPYSFTGRGWHRSWGCWIQRLSLQYTGEIYSAHVSASRHAFSICFHSSTHRPHSKLMIPISTYQICERGW